MAAPPPDLALGSFSDDPPWIVDPDAMPWRDVVDAVRWTTRRRLPELTRPTCGTRRGRVSSGRRRLVVQRTASTTSRHGMASGSTIHGGSSEKEPRARSG
ncbi:MAG: hypothetical protein ACKOIA_10360, partial [Acidimicrobiia bacterium]